ncbi:hypothetical protein K435DRAFT_849215 [Dendrothele bispora CBS 962.96]|uniref:Uncharacterized protein n=1 Tax=Dendrothele bispora (strain CBS 962.96) TaxID=1314807 RepID=A0A4V4HID7_DENBC|nr:hypothetical protein K435DRAFT_849215 [Dendrothele bispora CBS 962.96]
MYKQPRHASLREGLFKAPVPSESFYFSFLQAAQDIGRAAAAVFHNPTSYQRQTLILISGPYSLSDLDSTHFKSTNGNPQTPVLGFIPKMSFDMFNPSVSKTCKLAYLPAAAKESAQRAASTSDPQSTLDAADLYTFSPETPMLDPMTLSSLYPFPRVPTSPTFHRLIT